MKNILDTLKENIEKKIITKIKQFSEKCINNLSNYVQICSSDWQKVNVLAKLTYFLYDVSPVILDRRK